MILRLSMACATCIAALLVWGWAAGDRAGAHHGPDQEPILLDLTGASLFWRVLDGVTTGAIDPDSARALLATHPGYQQIDRSGNRLTVIRHCLRRMTPGVELDTIATPESRFPWLYPYVCEHLDRVRAQRTELEAYAEALRTDAAEQARITAALDSALTFLPAGAREVERPTIYGMFFEPGGFGGTSIAVDLLHHLRRPAGERTGFLAHEIHHALLARLPSDVPEAGQTSDSPIPWWLGRLQWEGIASLLDKRGHVQPGPTGPVPRDGAEGFALEHATRMSASPGVLAAVDSALAARARSAPGDSGAQSSLRAALEASIPDGGHALGQYMAMAIEQHGGREALIDAASSRFRFLRLYQLAAASHDGYARPFSDLAMRQLLDPSDQD